MAETDRQMRPGRSDDARSADLAPGASRFVDLLAHQSPEVRARFVAGKSSYDDQVQMLRPAMPMMLPVVVKHLPPEKSGQIAA